MYSNSSAFLGGGNSSRPGQQPSYGQQNSFLNPNPNQQQPGGYGQPQPLQNQYTGFPGQQPQYAQPTGQPAQYAQQSQFGQQPLQAQYTGFPGQQNPMQTGYGQQPPSQQPQPPPMPLQQPSFQMSQPTGAPPAAQPQRPQPTGMTSSQMADSFRGTSSQPAPAPKPSATGNKTPSIRLSFITAQDQAKFEQLFKSAVATGNALPGDQARDILMRSKLDGNALSDIWYGQLLQDVGMS
jgi:hypothetical protein